ncbi:MAG: hypothetical protein GY753_00265 [Gammaproteobacteria bacterium]|nr:hypothetical protein [Gammaproteobacteria bacterium]
MVDILDIKGVGESAKSVLVEHGFKSVKAISKASIESVSAVPGFGPARSKAIILAAADLMKSGEADVVVEPVEQVKKKDKKKGKKKDKKKGKKKDKKKGKKKGKKK